MKRAFVCGSQIDGLLGVDGDVRRMAEALARRGFEVRTATGEQATRAGILAGYDQLIESSGPDDAAVFFYAGHGFHAALPDQPDRPWRCIVPTDLRASTEDDFRGISGWELSIKQAQLTARTRNTTIILDCCHAAQMSRNEAMPRALPHPLYRGFEAHLAALRARYGADYDRVEMLGNPDAVRLVACHESQTAWETRAADGSFGGVFTRSLVSVLDEVGDAPVSWAALADAIRARVLSRFHNQRPEVEGPVHRCLFSLVSQRDRGNVTLLPGRDASGGYLLPVGRLTGACPGDVYAVMPVGSREADESRMLARLELTTVAALTATATLASPADASAPALPVDAVAIPLEQRAALRPVQVEAPPWAMPAIEQALRASRTLRRAAPGEDGALGALRVHGHDTEATLSATPGATLSAEDAQGPLGPPSRFPDGLATAVYQLTSRAIAQSLRELEGEDGVALRELEVELAVIERGELRALPRHGSSVGLGDRLVLRVQTQAARPLYVHVINVSASGEITLVTRAAPSGVELRPGGRPFVLGQAADGRMEGLSMDWPADAPRTEPRLEELMVVATADKASLLDLERTATPTAVAPPAVTRSTRTRLEARVAQLCGGVSRGAPARPGDGFLLTRLSVLLHPRLGALASPRFQVEDRPLLQAAAGEPGAWQLTSPGPPAPPESGLPQVTLPRPPAALAIALGELVVNRNGAPFSSELRVDALVCTRASAGHAGCAAWTQRFRGVRSGQRLALDRSLLYLGPVQDFVELSLWVSRDVAGSPDLSELLATHARDAKVVDALATLRAPQGAGPTPWISAVGGSAVLSRLAHDLVRGVSGTSIGLYRCSLLPGEQFGLGRHPAQGLLCAQHFSFSLLIEPARL